MNRLILFGQENIFRRKNIFIQNSDYCGGEQLALAKEGHANLMCHKITLSKC